MNFAAVLIALVTLGAGVALGWALSRARVAADASRQAAVTATVIAERDAVSTDRDQLQAERVVMQGALRDADTKVATAAAKLEALQQNEEQLKDTFARMSSEALQRSSAQFLDLADARFKQAGAPLTDTLVKVEVQLREIEKERMGAQQALRQQIDQVMKSGDALRQETASLVSAMSKPQARGRWGELQLRRCVELAGMTDRCDFFEQTSVLTADGVLRPDMLIRLIGGKNIVVDSKVTLSAYLEAYESTDDTVREQHLLRHAKHLKQHVNDLAAKAYWSQFSPTPEFVILFVPGDSFLAAALDHDPGLIDEAFTKRIHIATPTTLISTLRTVAYTWQQQALADNAKQVFELGRELYQRISKLGAKFDVLGKRLGSAVGAYNDSVASLESRVLPQARKLRDLKVVDEDLAAPRPVEEAVRQVAAAELVVDAEEARAVIALPSADELDGRTEDYGIDAGATPDAFGRRTGS